MNNKYSTEEVVEEFTELQKSKLSLLYASDWNNLKSFADLVISGKLIEGLGTFVNAVNLKCDAWLDLYSANDEIKQKYYEFLLRSTLMCVEPSMRKEGVIVKNDLPISLEIYINESFANTLKSLNNEVGAIEEFNRVRDEVILPKLAEKWNMFGIKCRVMNAVTDTDNKFDKICVEIKQVRTMTQNEAIFTNQKYVDSKTAK